MSDKTKKSVFSLPAAKPTAKTKRPATATVNATATTSRVGVPSTAIKDKVPQLRQKLKLNMTALPDGDTTTPEDKTKKSVFSLPAAKPPAKTKRPATVNATATTSRVGVPSTAVKEKVPQLRQKLKLNMTMTALPDGDTTTPELTPDLDEQHRHLTYRRFLRTMLEGCLVEEKIKREETEMEVQMTLLAERFNKSINHLDKYNRRLKEISFVAEQKRLLDMKNRDCSKFFDMMENSNSEELIRDLNDKQQAALDRLEIKNIDFGYDKESGHKQLQEAVEDAIQELEEIKKHSQLDTMKLKEYEKSQKSMEDVEKARTELERVHREFEKKFPNYSEKLLKEASETMSRYMNSDDEEDDD